MKQESRKLKALNIDAKAKQVEVEILPDGRMTLKEAAKFLGFTPHSLYRHHHDAEMPPYVKIRKRIFYYYNDLVKWVDNFKKVKP